MQGFGKPRKEKLALCWMIGEIFFGHSVINLVQRLLTVEHTHDFLRKRGFDMMWARCNEIVHQWIHLVKFTL